jgi:serine/threonine protein kinase
MEYLDGVDLKSLINYCAEHDLTMPRRVIFELIAATASALEAAYYREPLRGGNPLHLIHRDIKPSNVMVTAAGDIKVLDFGTAQARFENREAQTQALAFGSQAYMAPERLLGDPDAPSGDIFSLGVTLYELLSLEGFGKIHIRPERYDESHLERMAKLDLSGLDETQSAQIRQTLELLLMYEASERPDARQVLELMEALSDEIHDGSLRRFCREVVVPCRDQLVGGRTADDPLAGSTLFEDASGIRGDWIGQDGDPEEQAVADPTASGRFMDGSVHTADPAPPLATSTMPFEDIENNPLDAKGSPDLQLHDEPTADEPPMSPGEPATREAPEALDSSGDVVTPAGTDERSRADAPQPSLPPPPALNFAQTISPSLGKAPKSKPAGPETVVPTPERSAPSAGPEKSSGGFGKLLVLCLVFILMVGVAGAAVIVSGLIDLSGPSTTELEPEPEPIPTELVVEGIDGQRIEVGAVGPDAGTVILVVEGAVGSIKLNAFTGDFEQVWNGTGELELVGLAAGVYRTVIVAESTVRSTIESVPEETCRYTFKVDQGVSEWESDCE